MSMHPLTYKVVMKILQRVTGEPSPADGQYFKSMNDDATVINLTPEPGSARIFPTKLAGMLYWRSMDPLMAYTVTFEPVPPPPSRTTVVNVKGHRPYDIMITRPGKWGNPFKIGRDPSGGTWSRGDVIRLYRAWIQTEPELLSALGELRGKVLGCYCKPLACHGDVLAELANAVTPLEIEGEMK